MISRTSSRTRRAVAGALSLALVLVAGTGCSEWEQKKYERIPAKATAEPIPGDIEQLINPGKKYLGMAADGLPASVKPLQAFNKLTHKTHNMVKFYTAYGESYDNVGVKNLWSNGALPFIEWEPHDKKGTKKGSLLKRIADKDPGEMAHAFQFATDIAKLNIPIAISFEHEFNGYWYDWGTKYVTPEDVVKAWRNLHDEFIKAGATNVIWAWTPNVTLLAEVKKHKLKDFYPGDGYVDWIGMVGYYTETQYRSFDEIFQPTIDEVRRTVSKTKPLIIAETAASYETTKKADIKDLFTTVSKRKDILGLLWFNYDKMDTVENRNYKVNTAAGNAGVYQQEATAQFGFDPRKLVTGVNAP